MAQQHVLVVGAASPAYGWSIGIISCRVNTAVSVSCVCMYLDLSPNAHRKHRDRPGREGGALAAESDST